MRTIFQEAQELQDAQFPQAQVLFRDIVSPRSPMNGRQFHQEGITTNTGAKVDGFKSIELRGIKNFVRCSNYIGVCCSHPPRLEVIFVRFNARCIGSDITNGWISD